MEHFGHELTLGLVAIATLAELASDRLPIAHTAVKPLGTALHWIHWLSLGIAIGYLLLRWVFGRNVALNIAATLDARPQHPITTLFSDGVPYRYQRLLLDDRALQFVSSPNSKAFADLITLNEKGFTGSAFEITGTKLQKRNAEWVTKNAKVFALVRSPSDSDTIIGYSSIVPLTAVGADVYFRGLLKDQDIPASLICGAAEPSECLLIFAVVLREDLQSGSSLEKRDLNRLLKVVEAHAGILAATHHSGVAAKLWTQAEHKKIIKHLKRRGFREPDPPLTSADGFQLMFRPLQGDRSAANVGKSE